MPSSMCTLTPPENPSPSSRNTRAFSIATKVLLDAARGLRVRTATGWRRGEPMAEQRARPEAKREGETGMVAGGDGGSALSVDSKDVKLGGRANKCVAKVEKKVRAIVAVTK